MTTPRAWIDFAHSLDAEQRLGSAATFPPRKRRSARQLPTEHFADYAFVF
jgi:hypothetical protein